jgi:cystathionine beta-synthase
VRVSDADAFAAARRLTREEGILAGESSGTALVSALAVARELTESGAGTEAIVVVLFPDTGRNYLSKLYNDEWLREHGLLTRPGSIARVGDLLSDHHHGTPLPPLVVVHTTETVGAAITRLQEFGISQMPVSEAAVGAEVCAESLVGSVSDRGLLDRAFRDPSVIQRTVGEVMDRPLPLVDENAAVEESYGLLSSGAQAVILTRDGAPTGIATRLDLLEFLNHTAAGGRRA